jgi:UDP-N-acetylglucosamine acyltransferase
MIHKTAIIDPSAKIADDVEIGPYTVIGHDVEIGSGTWIGPNVVISKWTKIGKANKIYQFASIGSDPQDSHYKEEESYLTIGDNNVFHPCVTVNRGTAKQNLLTSIGNDNLFMAYAHIAHDCTIGDHTVFVNGSTLAGHIVVDDHATVGAFCAIHQFCNIGAYSFTAHGAMVTKDILPYLMVSGNKPTTVGLNSIGLERNGFSAEAIKTLQKAYKIIFREGLIVADAMSKLEDLVGECPEVQAFIDGLNRAKRGIIR